MMPYVTQLLVCFLLPSIASAENAKQVFDELYGPKVRMALTTGDKADALALARELLRVAKTTPGQPELSAAMCDAAYDLSAKHTDGFGTAIEAMQWIMETIGSRQSSAREKLIAVLSRQIATSKGEQRVASAEQIVSLWIAIGDEKADTADHEGAIVEYRRALAMASTHRSERLDEVKSRLDLSSRRDRATKQAERLRERLLKDASDLATAEELVRVCVVELNDPALAKRHLIYLPISRTAKMVSLAAEPIARIGPDDCRALGEWYKDHADNVKPPASIEMLERSGAYLSRFLTLYREADLIRTKAELLLKDVNAARDRLAHVVVRSPISKLGNNKVKLTIIDAQYGIEGSWVDITDKLQKMVVQDRLGIFVSTTFVGQDPRFGATKSLRVRYSLGDEEIKADIPDGDVFAITAPIKVNDNGKLRIIEAKVGANLTWVDVTEAVRNMVKSDTLSVTVDQGQLGLARDPVPFTRKSLIIVYGYRGLQRVKYGYDRDTLTLP